jgi:Tol biopolymer transport system component
MGERAMKRARALAACVALAAAALASLGATARADVFEPITLASVGLLEGGGIVEQAGVAEHPALSGDGRYVAFDATFGGVTGVWRRDLSTGALEQVAGGDAELPSISDDGRYVSFTTNEGGSLPAITNGRLDEHPAREAVNVYRRDMTVQPQQAGAFAVASAPSGSVQPLTYQTPEGLGTSFGSIAAGRSAISADGRFVAFVTTAVSDLVEPRTPADQVAVRDMEEHQTTLVSVEYEHGATTRPVSTVVSGGETIGAAYRAEAFPAGATALARGASISADGSTVAWMGQEIAKQAPTLGPTEASPEYIEPLWRRIDEGPQAPTRRITGGADPATPACLASGESEPSRPLSLQDPCQGPFEATLNDGKPGVYTAASRADWQPRLSANGSIVAFLASQRLLAGGEAFVSAQNTDDLYVVNIADGLTRVAALRRLTELASGNPNITGGFAPITDLGVSPDGSEIALSTARTAFPLGSPAFVSPQAGRPEMQEIYDIDLASDTLTRVTHGYASETEQSQPGGALVEQTEAGSPSFSGDGNLLAFSSAAINLTFGDGNRASSVFVVSRKRFAGEAVQQFVSAPPAAPNINPAWLLGVSARSRRDGTVLLEVQTPGAGRLAASASGAVRIRSRSHAARRGHDRSRRARRNAGTRVVARRVASGAKGALGEGLVTLTLVLRRPYRTLAAARGGLSASVALTFVSAGHATLHAHLPVAFVRARSRTHHVKRRASGTRRVR